MMHTHAIKHLLDALRPYTVENGGPLKVEHVWYVEGRGNLMIEYTPEGAKGEWEGGRREGDAILVLCTLHILYLFSQGR